MRGVLEPDGPDARRRLDQLTVVRWDSLTRLSVVQERPLVKVRRSEVRNGKLKLSFRTGFDVLYCVGRNKLHRKYS